MSIKLGVELPGQIVVMDTETTGTDVEKDRIITCFVGVMSVATGEIFEKWSWFINPGIDISEGATAVHGITNEDVTLSGQDPKEAIFQIIQRLDILQRRGLACVAMNCAFDYTIIDRETLRHWPNIRAFEPKLVFDPMVFDRAVDKFRKGSRKLVDLAAHYGVPVETNAHDAEADCRMAGRVAIKLLGHSRLAELTMSEVHAKLILTHRNNNLSLASYWATNKGLPGATPQQRKTAVEEVRATAGQWPMRPRPQAEGVSE